jgi:MraZ protein
VVIFAGVFMDNYSFRGHYYHSMDDKGRILIPKPFRFDKSNDPITTFIITKGFGKCLYAFPNKQWTLIEDRLKRRPVNTEKDAYDLRNIIAFTDDQNPDSMGRISINKYFRKLANLNSDIAVIGMLTHLEIWDKDQWEDYISTSEHSEDEIDDIILKIGFFDGEYS